MFFRLLEVSWESARVLLFPLTLAAFGLPLLAVQTFGADPSVGNLQSLDPWLPFFPTLAMAIGFSLALAVWSWDHQGDHIYALSLPVTRAGWAFEKMSAGIALLLIPSLGFALGAFIAAATLDVPEGLNAYPLDLSLRFFFASLVAYSMMFALAAGSLRTATVVIGGALTVLVFGQLALSLGAGIFGYREIHVIGPLLDAAQAWPGPAHVFTGDWLLIDV
jgi:hypothetical protein